MIKENIPTKVLSFETSPIEGFFIEINLWIKKILLCYSYNPDSSNIKNHLSLLSVSLDINSSQYEYFIVFGDFNVDFNGK